MKLDHRGFTLIELIMVMVVIGIMAMMALPRFFDNNVFQNRGAADAVKAALRYGQKVAIAQRHNVSVNIVVGSGLNCDATVAAYVVSCTIPADVAVSRTLSGAVTFDALGKPYYNATVALLPPSNTITVGGTVIAIEQETGYVH